jgi:hypothetical protein
MLHVPGMLERISACTERKERKRDGRSGEHESHGRQKEGEIKEYFFSARALISSFYFRQGPVREFHLTTD